MKLKDFPDHHDAELVLKLYELRTEAVMRESRAAINAFWPKTWEEFQAVLKPDHPLNSAFRQTNTYWEMAYGMVKHGILHGDYMLESNGEGLLLYAKVQPFLEQYRATGFPRAFINAQWVVENTEMGKGAFARFQARVKKMQEGK